MVDHGIKRPDYIDASLIPSQRVPAPQAPMEPAERPP